MFWSCGVCAPLTRHHLYYAARRFSRCFFGAGDGAVWGARRFYQHQVHGAHVSGSIQGGGFSSLERARQKTRACLTKPFSIKLEGGAFLLVLPQPLAENGRGVCKHTFGTNYWRSTSYFVRNKKIFSNIPCPPVRRGSSQNRKYKVESAPNHLRPTHPSFVVHCCC